MTKRLEDAIKELTPEELEKLTEYAEQLARAVIQPRNLAPGPMKLDWAGCLKNGPYGSGLEAQEAAKHIRIFLLQRSMPK
jgi:hypothetical protein